RKKAAPARNCRRHPRDADGGARSVVRGTVARGLARKTRAAEVAPAAFSPPTPLLGECSCVVAIESGRNPTVGTTRISEVTSIRGAAAAGRQRPRGRPTRRPPLADHHLRVD